MVNLYNAEAFNADVNGKPVPAPGANVPYGYATQEEYEKAQEEVAAKRDAQQAKLDSFMKANADEDGAYAKMNNDAETTEKPNGEKVRMTQEDAMKLLAALIGGNPALPKTNLFSDIKAAYNAVEDFRVTAIALERTIRDSANPQRKIEVTLSISSVAVDEDDCEDESHDKFSVS